MISDLVIGPGSATKHAQKSPLKRESENVSYVQGDSKKVFMYPGRKKSKVASPTSGKAYNKQAALGERLREPGTGRPIIAGTTSLPESVSHSRDRLLM